MGSFGWHRSGGNRGDPVLKKDLIELCLLQLLTVEDQYGYVILDQIHRAFPGTQESAVYALLRGLCKDGCTEQYEGRTSDGPTRKYYRITAAGLQRYDQLLRDWRCLRDGLTALGIE